MTDQRASQVKRAAHSFGKSGGEWTESRIFATGGKAMCIWLIWYNAPALINHWEVLVVLLGFLIMPDIIRKALPLILTRGVVPAQKYRQAAGKPPAEEGNGR
mgnify:CR=1 FL=1